MVKKLEIDKETLYRLYILENKTRKEIGKLCGIKEDRVKTIIKKLHIIKGYKKPEIDKKTLYKLFVEENKTRKEIACLYNIKEDKVKSLLKKYKIKKPKDKIHETLVRLQTPERRKRVSEIQKVVRNTPESKLKTSIASKNNWKSEEYRKKHKEATERLKTDSEYLKKCSENSKKMWKKPGYREKRRKTIQNLYKNNAEYHKKRSELSKAQWKNEETRQKHSISAKRSLNSPEYLSSTRKKRFTGKHLDIYLDDNLLIEKIKELKTMYDLCAFFNISHSCFLNRIKRLPHAKSLLVHKKSNQENALFDYVQSIYQNEIIRNCKSILDNRLELDLYLPELKLGIEYNGIYWHSTKKVPKEYHFNKVIAAKEAGISLLQIWEHDWEKNKVRTKDKIYKIINNRFNVLEESKILYSTTQFQLIETPLAYYNYSFFENIKDYEYTKPKSFFINRGNYEKVESIYNACITECYDEGTIIWKNYF